MADSKFLLGLIASLVISSILIALIVGDTEIRCYFIMSGRLGRW